MIENAIPNNRTAPAVVVSRPGMMQQSLCALLEACPWIEVIAAFGDGLSALNQLARLGPRILVIDSNLLEEEVDALLCAVKARYPDIRCVALVRSGLRNEQLRIEGADAVVLRSGSAQNFQDALFCLAYEKDLRPS